MWESGLLCNLTSNTFRNQTDTLPSAVTRHKTDVETAIHRSLHGDSYVYEMLQYSMGWLTLAPEHPTPTKGKAIRSALCLLACEAVGGVSSRALPAAISLELVHHFSLIHDDIQDRDQTRHHRPTLWAIWGEPKAIVAGNTLRVISDMSMWNLLKTGIPVEKSLLTTNLLTESYLEMIEGQYLDLSYEGIPNIGMSKYIDMIGKKSGALIRCALNIGAILGTHDPVKIRAFREFGKSLGFVFQIRDDILGIWGNPKHTGKPVGGDIKRRKNSLPIIYAMSEANTNDKNLLAQIYRKNTLDSKDISTVLDIMDKIKVKKFAESLGKKYHQQALSNLSGIQLSKEFSDDVQEIANFLLTREK